MDRQKRRNAFGNNWMAIATVVGLICLNGIVSARPADDRGTRESRTALSYDHPLSLANTEEKDMIGQAKEELSGILKERHKRFSDQRRAELETLMVLTGKLMNMIRAVRQLESARFVLDLFVRGFISDRHKRAVFDLNMKNLQKLFRLSGRLGLKGNAAYPVIS
ncbi:uncharacterized protein LOC108628935 isoform X1 [Ceratina calcarata]|uniref:Uncharacterized protein LOC108628935 isoform X1 n=1 Tax=Ceratina calcarata TaxID=156304 RepID=A0AAJ7S795_9HYME|nr:uncharacterized protein LOC108628935 isoform X1 [Ceratina calcarata]